MRCAVSRVGSRVRERCGFAAMRNSIKPKTWVRVVNGLAALAVAAFVLGNYWPIVKLFGLARADLQYQGEWIGGHAKRITAVTSGGVADRAGLRPGDVLEFDPSRNDDWVLAAYRNMPVGFTGTLPVRHADGTRAIVSLAPERVAYLPNPNDRLALMARLAGLTTAVLVGLVLVWARPCLMTWSLLLAFIASSPAKVWSTYFLAFDATSPALHPTAVAVGSLMYLWAFILPAVAAFPRDTLEDWPVWKRALGVAALLGGMIGACPGLYVQAFTRDTFPPQSFGTLTVLVQLTSLAGIAALMRTYRRSAGQNRARLKWALLGMSVTLVVASLVQALFILPFNLSNPASGSALTAGHWLTAVNSGVIFPLTLGYAVLRQQVVDVQFAISRTVVYGVVSTIVLVFLAVLHWLLGRMIEHSGFAFGLEGLAAVGLGLVLHRASHGINTTVDRVLFRKHHAAEERLRQVTAALPFAGTEQSIAQAIVVEPTRNLELASAALFYRESSEGPLRRVLAVGWSDSHAATIDAESLLVRYLQAEHAALRLDDEQEWLPAGMPEGPAHPVLAIPIVTQHVLAAVVLYGAHENATLPDADEVLLLEALAKAAAASHQQVRIATLSREVETQRIKNEQLEASFRVLARARVGAPPVEGAQ